jgi:hypothetical protein
MESNKGISRQQILVMVGDGSGKNATVKEIFHLMCCDF